MSLHNPNNAVHDAIRREELELKIFIRGVLAGVCFSAIVAGLWGML